MAMQRKDKEKRGAEKQGNGTALSRQEKENI